VLPRLRFQPFWHLLQVPSPSRTLSWLDMPAPPTHSLKRSVTLGRKRLRHHPVTNVMHKQSLWDRLGIQRNQTTVESGLSLVSTRPLSGLLLPHTVMTGFMPCPSLHAVSVWMMNPFAWQWVCSWGATFAFHMRAFVALRLMPVGRMPSFANGRLAESPDIRL